MSSRPSYAPGAAAGASLKKEGETWTLVLVRELKHPPAKVWTALTDPQHLREWAPFDSDRNLGTAGATAMLTTVGAPKPHVTETRVKRGPRVVKPADLRSFEQKYAEYKRAQEREREDGC